MKYHVEITRRAMEGLAALPAGIRSDLSDRIAELAADPLPYGAEPLRDEFAGCRKLRVGDYRIVYAVERESRSVVVLRVGHRHNVYK